MDEKKRKAVATFKEMYDADVSPMLIAKVTNTVKKPLSGKIVSWMDYKAVTRDLSVTYQARTDESVKKVVWLTIQAAL